MLNFSERDDHSDYELGYFYKNFLSENLRGLLDGMISLNQNKISIIKFLRTEGNLTLIDAKKLYEARHAWLEDKPNPFCF